MKKHEIAERASELVRQHEAAPDDVTVLMELGALYSRLAKTRRKALLAYDKVLKLQPRHAKALEKRAFLLQTLGEHDAAVEALQEFLRIKPKSAKAWRELADLCSFPGKEADLAEEAYQSLLKLRPQDWRSWNNLGMFYKDQGRLAEAESCIQLAVERTPDKERAGIGQAIVKNLEAVRKARQDGDIAG